MAAAMLLSSWELGRTPLRGFACKKPPTPITYFHSTLKYLSFLLSFLPQNSPYSKSLSLHHFSNVGDHFAGLLHVVETLETENTLINLK
jgi:hypothetical protein